MRPARGHRRTDHDSREPYHKVTVEVHRHVTRRTGVSTLDANHRLPSLIVRHTNGYGRRRTELGAVGTVDG